MAADRKIGVTTPLGSDTLIIRTAEITEELGKPFTMSVNVLCTDENLDLAAAVEPTRLAEQGH